MELVPHRLQCYSKLYAEVCNVVEYILRWEFRIAFNPPIPILVEANQCGQYICLGSSSAPGSISSPNYPSNYDNFGHCIWLIEAPTGHAISLNISHLALEKSGDGSCLDYLQVMIKVHKTSTVVTSRHTL